MNRNILGWGWVGGEEHSQSQITLIENKNEEVIMCQITKGQMLTEDAQSHTERQV